MSRVRVAGVIFMDGGIALMHRIKKTGEMQNYYTFPGGGLEEGETPKEGVIREIKEELGIDVEVKEKLYETTIEKLNQKEMFFLCEYKSGILGTGDGPEFSNNPNYADSGKYIPEIIPLKDVSNILLVPEEVKEKLLKEWMG